MLGFIKGPLVNYVSLRGKPKLCRHFQTVASAGLKTKFGSRQTAMQFGGSHRRARKGATLPQRRGQRAAVRGVDAARR